MIVSRSVGNYFHYLRGIIDHHHYFKIICNELFYKVGRWKVFPLILEKIQIFLEGESINQFWKKYGEEIKKRMKICV